MTQRFLRYRNQQRATRLASPAQVCVFPDHQASVITERSSTLLVREPVVVDIVSEPDRTLVWS